MPIDEARPTPIAPRDVRDVVTIDGPSGAGKSTVARAVATRLGFTWLDTGAMYRAVALHVLNTVGAAPLDAARLAGALASLSLGLDDSGVVRLGGEDVRARLRERAVEALVSDVAASAAVRDRMVVEQRRFAAAHPCVVEGRDMGTVVFPAARWKVFLVASVDERARRRLADFVAAGRQVSLDDVRAEIEARDERDSGRDVAPLRRAPDARPIDTTGLSVDQVVDEIVGFVREGGTA